MERLVDKHPNLVHLTSFRREQFHSLLKRGQLQEYHLDDPRFVKKANYDLKIATHEAGHIKGVFYVRGIFMGATISPSTTYAGATWSMMNPDKSGEQQAFDRMIVAALGESAERYSGEDNLRGASSDQGTEWYLAQTLSNRTLGIVSASTYWSNARSIANSIAYNGMSQIRETAVDLYIRGSI